VVEAYGEEIHACGKGSDIRETDDALALEELTRHHRVTSKLPFIDDPTGDECQTRQHSTEDVARRPGVGVATGLECDEANNQLGDAGKGRLLTTYKRVSPVMDKIPPM
jgi:hypothetical protein